MRTKHHWEVQIIKLGFLVASFIIAWCTVPATRFIEKAADMRAQRYLVAYPLALFYSCFAIITIF